MICAMISHFIQKSMPRLLPLGKLATASQEMDFASAFDVGQLRLREQLDARAKREIAQRERDERERYHAVHHAFNTAYDPSLASRHPGPLSSGRGGTSVHPWVPSSSQAVGWWAV